MISPKFIYILQFNGKGKASTGLLFLYWPRCCCQTPPRKSRKDPNPTCHFDPQVLQTVRCFSSEKKFSSLHFGRISGRRKCSLICHLTFIRTGKAVFGLLFIYMSQHIFTDSRRFQNTARRYAIFPRTQAGPTFVVTVVKKDAARKIERP